MSKLPQKLPQFIDPLRLSDSGRMYSGAISIRQMKRLLPLLEDNVATALQVDLRFDKDSNAVRYLAGSIDGEINVKCQRCLSTMKFSLKLKFLNAFVATEYDGELLGAEYEPYIVTQTPIMLSDILEDELLLALPTVPKHEFECVTDYIEQTTHISDNNHAPHSDIKTKKNPFSILSQLKK